MRDFIYHDIETIPTQDERVIEKIRQKFPEPVLQTSFSPPSNYKDPAKIEEWLANKRASAESDFEQELAEHGAKVRQAIHKTGLDGGYGHVCCIGFTVNDREINPLVIDDIADEADLIRESFSAIEKLRNRDRAPTWVGHNWINFDNRFIWQRAIVLGIELPGWFPRNLKPWAEDVHDTMVMWAGARDMIGMDRLCEILGLEGKGDDGMDGSIVADRWAAGDYERVAFYCAGDIRRTQAMHRRFLHAYGMLHTDATAPIPSLDDEIPV